MQKEKQHKLSRENFIKVKENAEQLKAHKGEYYERWKKAMRRFSKRIK